MDDHKLMTLVQAIQLAITNQTAVMDSLINICELQVRRVDALEALIHQRLAESRTPARGVH